MIPESPQRGRYGSDLSILRQLYLGHIQVPALVSAEGMSYLFIE